MSRRTRRILKWTAFAAGAALAAHVLWNFPWRATAATLRGADLSLLLVALAINLVSLVAKGWGWHLLLGSAVPSRWWVVQEANLVGAAVSNLAIGAFGEAARVRFVVQRQNAPLGIVVASVFWARAVEVLGLGLFLLVAPSLQHTYGIVRGMQVLSGVVLVALLWLVWSTRRSELPRWLPGFARRGIIALTEVGSVPRVSAALLLALVNWTTQWATYHLTLLSSHAAVTYSESFAALVASNLAGLPKLSPGNVGVTQTSIALALLPFGVPAERSVAAAVALQAIQVIPVLLLGALLVGWKGLVPRRGQDALADGPGGRIETAPARRTAR
jgi:uncharacterized membrane protein YbhN (UPF0104 family)